MSTELGVVPRWLVDHLVRRVETPVSHHPVECERGGDRRLGHTEAVCDLALLKPCRSQADGFPPDLFALRRRAQFEGHDARQGVLASRHKAGVRHDA